MFKHEQNNCTSLKVLLHINVIYIDKCISTEQESKKVINQLEERNKQLEIEKNRLLTTLEENKEEIQQLTSI